MRIVPNAKTARISALAGLLALSTGCSHSSKLVKNAPRGFFDYATIMYKNEKPIKNIFVFGFPNDTTKLVQKYDSLRRLVGVELTSKDLKISEEITYTKNSVKQKRTGDTQDTKDFSLLKLYNKLKRTLVKKLTAEAKK